MGSRRVGSLLVSFVTGPPCIVHSRFSTILVEGINKCMSTRVTEIEAELLVIKIIFSGGQGTYPHLADEQAEAQRDL